MGFATGLNHFPVRQHDGKLHHIVGGGAVFYRLNTGCIVCDHPPDGGVGTGVRRKEKAVFSELPIQRLPQDARLKVHLKILGSDFQNAVHSGKVKHQPAPHGDGVSFRAGSRPPRRDRNVPVVRKGQDL